MVEGFLKYTVEFNNLLAREAAVVIQNLSKKVLPSTEFDDYKLLEVIGSGSTGHVLRAENIKMNKIVAIKIINKQTLRSLDQLNRLKREIRILNAINFEFLISLDCYFTNKCHVFIVLPYISGGPFFRLLRKLEKLDEISAKFFAGQVVSAIDYLHYMGIIYRDLKPENLVLDKQGYLKLVDFGFAKRVGRSLTYTFCGTPEYIAPEVLTNRGYNQSPDWWSFGILLYEMCYGSPPFTGKTDFILYQKILKGRIIWPKDFSSALKSLIQGLLQVDKTKRLGCMRNGSEDVKRHKWFATLNWSALLHKKILPPFKPGEILSFYESTRKLPKLKFAHDSAYLGDNNFGNIDFEA